MRGHHAYQGVWSPFTGEVLPLEREPDNPEDVHAVAIKKASITLDMKKPISGGARQAKRSLDSAVSS